MEVVKKSEETPTEEKKLSYEQLNEIAHQLSEQNRELYQKVQEMNMANIFKRLDYLFKVVDLSVEFKQEFVNKCKEEITTLMTLPKEEEATGEEVKAEEK